MSPYLDILFFIVVLRLETAMLGGESAGGRRSVEGGVTMQVVRQQVDGVRWWEESLTNSYWYRRTLAGLKKITCY